MKAIAGPRVASRLTPVLEIGGTHVTAALVAAGTCRVVQQQRFHLDSRGTSAEILDTLGRAAQSVVTTEGRWGVAIPGPFDYERGIGRFAHVGKFDSLMGVDVGAEFAARLGPGTEALFLNDADAFGIGEVIAGAGRGHRRVVCVTLGTGVGSAFIADDQPVNDGPDVPPGGSVHLLQWEGHPIEDAVSRRAIRRRFAGFTGKAPDVREIADLARSGHPAALQVFTECFTALGACLAPWIRSFQATALVVGGSIAQSFDLIETPLHVGIHRVEPQLTVPAWPAAHPDASALIGAAYHARRSDVRPT